MSYQVLARKWRPRLFREMVGQEHVLKALINALDHNRLHHAYLFTGTRGVGKTTIARILAKCLNCETGVSSEPCGTCSACREISEGRFVDLLEVDAASRTKVEDTRELLDNVQYAPTRGRYKIYLIDEVHMLSNHSFNALLKTLEEPPPHVKFLLATTDPQKLPVTILSRCLQFNLKNMTPERIVEHLRKVLGEEMVPFDDAALWLLARAADGSMRDGLSLTDQAISYGNGKVAEADVSAMLGTIDHKLIERLMAALTTVDAKAVLNAVAEFAEHAPDFHAALGDLIALLHRVAIAQVVPEAIDNSVGDKDQVLRFASALAAEDVQLFYQMALLGRRDLHLAPEPRGGFEMVLLRMLAFKPQGIVDLPHDALAQHTATPGEGAHPGKKSEAEPAAGVNLGAAREASPGAARLAALVGGAGVAAKAVKAPAAPTETQRLATASPPPGPAPRVDMAAILTEPARAAPAPVPEPPPAPPPQAWHKPLAALAPADWLSLFYSLNIRGVLQSTLANAVLVGVADNQLSFYLDDSKASLFDESHPRRLADALSDYFNEPVKVQIELKALDEATLTPARHQARLLEAARLEALTALQNDPVVQTLRDEFDAELLEESVQFAKPSLMPQ